MRIALDWLTRNARTTLGLALVLMAIAGSAQAGSNPPALSTPEIDPGSIGSALTLLFGGAILLRRQFGKG